MSEIVNLRARWGPRKETLEACAARVLEFLTKLTACDRSLAQTWLRCGRSLETTLANPVDITGDSLARILAGGVVRDDTDKSVIKDLGYGAGLCNLSNEGSTKVSFKCGAYTDL